MPELLAPLVPPEVPPDVPPLPELAWPEAPELAPLPELAPPDVPDELDACPADWSDEPLLFPELDPEPDGPVGPAGPAAGPAAKGPISRVEQSTAPHMSERAGGAEKVMATPVRMAIVIVEEQPTKAAAVFM